MPSTTRTRSPTTTLRAAASAPPAGAACRIADSRFSAAASRPTGRTAGYRLSRSFVIRSSRVNEITDLVHGDTVTDVGWFDPSGEPMTSEQWNEGYAKAVALYLNGEELGMRTDRGEVVTDRGDASGTGYWSAGTGGSARQCASPRVCSARASRETTRCANSRPSRSNRTMSPLM